MSEEQLAAVKALDTTNVILNSVAGSGKTTTAKLIVKDKPDKLVLILTYNKRLKEETRIRTADCGNVEVHSFNSWAYKYINTTCSTNDGLNRSIPDFVDQDFRYDIIIIDEVQDMTPLYYRLIQYIQLCNKEDFKYCLIGDERQCIYSYMDASPHYMKTPDLFKNKYDWTQLNLSHSFRITNIMSRFINGCMLHEDFIHSNKKSSDFIRYCITNMFSVKDFANEIAYYKGLGYKYEDMFILSNSTKNSGNNPLSLIINHLIKKDVPIYINTDDEYSIDNESIKNKLVFSTIHKVKGLERKVVILLHFDSFLTPFNAEECPNILYVAVTRASEQLSVLHHDGNGYLKFLDSNNLKQYCVFPYNKTIKGVISKSKQFNKSAIIKSFVRHLSQEKVFSCEPYYRVDIKDGNTIIKLANKTMQVYGNEEVNDINNEAISLYCYDKHAGNPMKTSVEYLKEANEILSKKTQYKHRINQIRRYDWITTELFEELYEQFEKLDIGLAVIKNYDVKFGGLNGTIDLLDGDTLFEIKTNGINSKHYISALLNLWCYYNKPRLSLGQTVEYDGMVGIIHKIFKNGNIDLMLASGYSRTKSARVKVQKADVPKIKRRMDEPKAVIMNIVTGDIHTIYTSRENLNRIHDEVMNEFYSIVIDTETTGFGNSDRIVELGYIIFKGDTIIKEYDAIIKPDGYTINNSHIHGITTEMAEDGKDIQIVMKQLLEDLKLCNLVIGHNIDFDMRMISNEVTRCGLNDEVLNINQYCTYKTGKCKLEVLWSTLTGRTYIQKHRALDDCILTLDCYRILTKK